MQRERANVLRENPDVANEIEKIKVDADAVLNIHFVNLMADLYNSSAVGMCHTDVDQNPVFSPSTNKP
ncbi:hypothetical protein [Mycolicibacterium vaccae]|uniref:hypothetical protein n=1 Tax=Mycolicibacterium vaccae TaxID=1810 RepID=UPI0007DD0FF8|nr:hypothetical protein [Mycolicibacterium vaccae]ANI37710.1 hypothetical protein MYVA_0443 [Mycolicibacterium vaccae 95051]MCV7060600.1 hypothetical protein [Mycolicibacterium vaccae]